MKERINVTRSSMPLFEEYVQEIRSLWDSRHLTNMGEKHQEFEARLCEFLGAENVTLFTNGHLALESVLRAMEFPEGGEVITTPFTFASTTHAIVRCGLTPVFCDVRESDLTVDPELIGSLITPATCAILPVHVYGNICDDEVISRIAKAHGIPVIYDAAHAFGASRDGKSAAALGDVAMFSFHATKVFHTIEGGALVYGDATLRDRLDAQKNFGYSADGSVSECGGNAKMNEFQAAMGICNLRHVCEDISERRRVFERYMSNLEGISDLRIPLQLCDGMNYAYLPVLFEGSYNRDEAAELLIQEKIYARKYFSPLTSELHCYRACDFPGKGSTPVAKKAAESVLTLPLYPELSDDDVDRICRIIIK